MSLDNLFAVTQQDYSTLGRLMIIVWIIGLLPLGALPLLREHERRPAPGRVAVDSPPESSRVGAR